MLELNTPTEPTIENLTEGQENTTVLDLSKKGLKKVPKPDDVHHIRELILDENLLQKIDNIESFLKLEKVQYTHSRTTQTRTPHFVVRSSLNVFLIYLFYLLPNKKTTRII